MGGDRLLKKTKRKHRSKTRHLQLKTTADNPPPPPLPVDVIGQILHRLPVKSLLQLKRVSKPWKSVISDPQFTRKQLQFSTTISNSFPRFISSVNTSSEGRKIVAYDIESLLKIKCDDDSIDINSKSFDLMDDYLILGSCNGLLCVFEPDEKSVILWNPCMNLKSERSITFVSPFGENGLLSYHGFGCYDYDQVNNVKYKVLIVSFNAGDFSETVTRIYTSGEDSWRTIQNFPYRNSGADKNRNVGKFVSGNLNWLVKKEDGGIKQEVILSFDIENETYGEVLLPRHDCEDVSNDILDVVGNCLCLCCDYNETHWVVWLLKEYRVAESWTKLMIIPHFKTIFTEPRMVCRLNFNQMPSFINPLFKSEYGIVIVKTVRSRLILYNIIKSGPSICRPCRWIRYDDLQIYHESLLSPQW